MDEAPFSNTSVPCVLIVMDERAAAPYASLIVMTRYGICVVRGRVIAPDPARTSSMVTAVAVLIDILALL
jgi:hypothetical protein